MRFTERITQMSPICRKQSIRGNREKKTENTCIGDQNKQRVRTWTHTHLGLQHLDSVGPPLPPATVPALTSMLTNVLKKGSLLPIVQHVLQTRSPTQATASGHDFLWRGKFQNLQHALLGWSLTKAKKQLETSSSPRAFSFSSSHAQHKECWGSPGSR